MTCEENRCKQKKEGIGTMSAQEYVLAFILTNEGYSSLQYEYLNNILIQSSEILDEYGDYSFDFFHRGQTHFSFVLEHYLERFEKKGFITKNGIISLRDEIALRNLSRKLDSKIQFKILNILSERTSRTSDSNKHLYKMSDYQETNSDYIFTTGYEGKTLDSFMITLLEAGIKNLIDVRCNAISRKFGFSKRQLETACSKINLKYIHIPGLGIPSESRQSLKTQKDYDNLFISYTKEILSEREDEQEQLIEIMNLNPSVLMCFEANPVQCHRTHLAKSLSSKTGKPVRAL